jgi:hypothetical protein
VCNGIDHTFWFEIQVEVELERVPCVGPPDPRTRRVRDVTRSRGIYLALFDHQPNFLDIHLMDDGNSITTRLLTLLNVSATKIGKRKRIEQDFIPSEKLNKRKSTASSSEEKENDEEGTVLATIGEDVEMEDEGQDTDPNGSFQSQSF